MRNDQNRLEDGLRDALVTGVQTCYVLFSSRRRHTRCLSDWISDVCSSVPSRRRHTRCLSDWSSDVCSSDLIPRQGSDLSVAFATSLCANGGDLLHERIVQSVWRGMALGQRPCQIGRASCRERV